VILVVSLVTFGEQLLVNQSGLVKCMYLSSFQCSCDNDASFPMQVTLIDWMSLYLDTSIKCVDSFMYVLYVLSIPVEAIASIFLEIYMSEHASGFGIKWIAERITNTTQSLSFYMYIYYLLIHIFSFVKYYAGFFFSIGVALRAFPPTRGAGAYLMAVSFGLYFVFPLAYILMATMAMPHIYSDVMEPASGSIYVPDPSVATDAGRSVCNPNPDGSYEYNCALPQVTEMEPYGCGGGTVGGMLNMITVLRANADALNSVITVHMFDFIMHLISAICIFPLVAFVVLLTFVLNVTNLFGGNIPEIGRGLVKLI